MSTMGDWHWTVLPSTHPFAGKGFSLIMLVAVAVATGIGCGGGLLLAVLALVTTHGR
jgi:hypothetical protein